MISNPRLVFAGASSGVGKTTLTIGLIAALAARGMNVRSFKCGPDYIDLSFHTLAGGTPCRNLDSWMTPRSAILELFARTCEQCDVAVVEGVMGLYDGRAGIVETGSTAEIAKLLGTPVILVIDVGKMARSAGAVALGYQAFDRDLWLAGFILNNIGSPTHHRWTSEAIENATNLPVLGYLPKNAELHLPGRHLGLVPSVENDESRRQIDRIREQVEATVDVAGLLAVAKTAPKICLADGVSLFPKAPMRPRARLAVAQDQAFSFYYQDNLDLLAAWGAELVPVSPVHDSTLPPADGLYVGGGFPEVYAAQLAANASFRASVRRAAEAGMPIYGECGGLMYLGEGISDFAGNRHEMVGIVPGWSAMQEQRVRMGYVTVRVQQDNIIAAKDQVLRGHEFHWSAREESATRAAYRLDDGERVEGFANGNLLASYVHLHFGQDAGLARRFVASCERWRQGR